MPPVERPLRRMLVRRPFIRIPHLHRRIDIHHTLIVAPLQQFAAVDVPRQVNDQVARAHILAQLFGHVVPLDLILHKLHPLLRPLLEDAALVLKIHHRNILQRHLDQLLQNRQRALRHRAITDKQNLLAKRNHQSLLSVKRNSRPRLLKKADERAVSVHALPRGSSNSQCARPFSCLAASSQTGAITSAALFCSRPKGSCPCLADPSPGSVNPSPFSADPSPHPEAS